TAAKLEQLLTDEQKKKLKERPTGFGPGGFGPGGFGRFSPITPVVPASVKDRLNLPDKQKKAVADLQKGAEGKLDKLLNDKQRKQLKGMKDGPRGFPGGPGRRPGGPPGGRPGGPPRGGPPGGLFGGPPGGGMLFRAYRYP